jgi:glutathione S-transferase
MSKVIIHGFAPSSYVRTVRMALEHKGVDYELVPLEFGSEAHQAMHPFVKMPVMQHGDLTLFESSAICHYIDSAFEGPALAPDGVVEQALMEQWISAVNDYYYGPFIKDFILQRIVAPSRGQEPDEELISAAMPIIRQRIDILEQTLSNRLYLAGDTFSLADCFLAPIFFYTGISPEGGELFAGKTNIAGWKARIGEHDCFRNTMPPKPQAAE